MAERTCSVDGCGRTVIAHGLCDPHYRRAKKYGDPLGSAGCWIWQGTLDGNGYGFLRVGGAQGRNVRAHRLAYELMRGAIPEGFELDHLCRVPRCVNPWHLEPVTHKENMLRGDTFAAAQAARTHCPRGHPYDEANTRIRRGKRECRLCARQLQRERKHRG